MLGTDPRGKAPGKATSGYGRPVAWASSSGPREEADTVWKYDGRLRSTVPRHKTLKAGSPQSAAGIVVYGCTWRRVPAAHEESSRRIRARPCDAGRLRHDARKEGLHAFPRPRGCERRALSRSQGGPDLPEVVDLRANLDDGGVWRGVRRPPRAQHPRLYGGDGLVDDQRHVRVAGIKRHQAPVSLLARRVPEVEDALVTFDRGEAGADGRLALGGPFVVHPSIEEA